MAAAVETFQRAHWPVGNRQVNQASRRWLFEQNPYGGESGPGFWICERGASIVGQQADMPVKLQVGERSRPMAWAIDLMVEPAWRLRGVGPAMIATVLGDTPIVGVLYASEHGYPAFTSSGCIDLGPMPFYRRPVRARIALQRPRVPTAVRRLAPLVELALRVVDAAVAAGLRLAGARLEPIARFDARVDDVWTSASSSYRVLVRRDQEALAWKIDQRPDAHQLRRFYLVRQGRPIGYVVLRYKGSPDDRTAIVVDYLAPPRWVAPLLVATARAARNEGAVAVSLRTKNPAADRALRRLGFLRNFQGGEWPIHHLVHCTDDPDICSLVTEPEAWFLTAADGDLDPALPPPDDLSDP